MEVRAYTTTGTVSAVFGSMGENKGGRKIRVYTPFPRRGGGGGSR